MTSSTSPAWVARLPAFSLLVALLWASMASGADIPAASLQKLLAGEVVDLIVEYDAAAVEAEAAVRRLRTPRRIDDAATLAFRAESYQALRRQVDAAVDPAKVVQVKDYKYLPMALRRFRSAAAAQAYAALPGVKAMFENEQLHLVLAQSLPLVGQPTVAGAGETGSGATVAVIDNGINYTRPEFGSCTAPGVPASCRVVASVELGTGSSDNNHGTNVSAIVLGVAPGARIAMLNAFSGTSAYFSDVIDGINWAITNQAAYNIVAINMSLGDGKKYTASCGNGNAFSTPVTNARNVGITVVAASGNEGFTDGIAKPACTPGVVSVGAVYDANVGGLNWGLCTDSTTMADNVACFSNSASFLTLLAPGALIVAGGFTMGGTSQASPHVAGAVAVLRATFPDETLNQTLMRFTSKGKPVTDPRNGIVFPRLNLLDSARPANDAFSSPFLLSGSSGRATGVSLLATKENGEPDHADNVGGHSVWWRWTAPAAGQVSLDTHDSGFDTLLAVYVGNSVGALQKVAANDNDNGAADGTSSTLFQVTAGTEYRMALDGANDAAGSSVINWSLNTAAKANLALGITGSSSEPGASIHTITVSNAGPQAATGVSVTISLPSGASYLSGSAGCLLEGTVVICTVGTLASGANAVLSVNLSWSTGGTTASISASVTSELPDPMATDNTQVSEVALGSIDGDVPTLPEWGMIVLLILLGSLSLLGPVRGARR
ncbi:MAG: S8 family serine peptidase [Rugosibacter sp.]